MKYTYELSVPADRNGSGFLFKKLGIVETDLKNLEILKKSIDARKKPEIFLKYHFLLEPVNQEIEKRIVKRGAKASAPRTDYIWPENVLSVQTNNQENRLRPVIVGFGPAGIFAALYLARAGMRPIVIERGAEMSKRIHAVEEFHNGGALNPDTNVQFGEGGAGTFSDGKLNTGVKDKSGRNRAVLEVFHEFGAPKDILYDGRAHIGTDVIRKVVVNIRKEIERLGGEVWFQTKLIKPEIKDGKLCGIWIEEDPKKNDEALESRRFLACTDLILAIGHSARDTYEMLHSMNFSMEPKSFAVGFRVIHKADYINECQYGEGYKTRYPNLPTAYYKLAYTSSFGRNVYSFCMCPGGYVVNASSEEGRLAINGMSNAARDGEYSNAAMVMNVGPDDFGDDILSGMIFQRKLEETAYKLGAGCIPVQLYKDFESTVIKNRFEEEEPRKEESSFRKEENSFLTEENGSQKEENTTLEEYQNTAIYGALKNADLTSLFTDSMNQAFVEGMRHFNRSMTGYADENPLLCGVESRTSAPIRILRDETLQSVTVEGIYPCGEGAGYAGGITSAAMDGLRCAEAVYLKA